MNDNPYKKYSESSEYHFGGHDEEYHIEKLRKRISATHRNRVTNKKRQMLLLAALAGICSVLTFVWLQYRGDNNSPNPEQYYAHYQNYVSTALRGSETSHPLHLAYDLYDQKKYEEAIVKFEEDAQILSPLDSFYLGISMAAIQNWKGADSIFQQLSKEEIGIHGEALMWYKALVYLGSNQLQKCKSTLTDILESDSFYKERAKAVLNDLQ